jgi:hypothetical protein
MGRCESTLSDSDCADSECADSEKGALLTFQFPQNAEIEGSLVLIYFLFYPQLRAEMGWAPMNQNVRSPHFLA